MSLSLVLVRRQPDGRMRRRRRSEVGGCRAGFPACRFGGLSSPPKCPDVQGAWDVRDFLGTDSPKNRQARQPALQAHGWNQTFVETRTSGSFRRSRSGRRRAGPRRPAGCPPAIRLPVCATSPAVSVTSNHTLCEDRQRGREIRSLGLPNPARIARCRGEPFLSAVGARRGSARRLRQRRDLRASRCFRAFTGTGSCAGDSARAGPTA